MCVIKSVWHLNMNVDVQLSICICVTSLSPECTANSNFLSVLGRIGQGGHQSTFAHLSLLFSFRLQMNLPSQAMFETKIWMDVMLWMNVCSVYTSKENVQISLGFRLSNSLRRDWTVAFMRAGWILCVKPMGHWKVKRPHLAEWLRPVQNTIHKEQILHQ